MGKLFFEKLKKGMDEEIISNEKNIPEQPTAGQPKVEKAGKKKKDKKETIIKKKKIKVYPEKEKLNGVKEENPPVPVGGEKKWFESEGQLTIDVYQTDKEIVIQSAVAGIEPGDLDITIENDMVTIRGNREELFEEKKKNYFYQECYWGQFSREIILPEEVDNSRAKATMKKGILTIRMPKIESKKKRKISVKE